MIRGPKESLPGNTSRSIGWPVSDLKRFKPGTRLKIEGELVRYYDRDHDEKSDEIYIDRALVASR